VARLAPHVEKSLYRLQINAITLAWQQQRCGTFYYCVAISTEPLNYSGSGVEEDENCAAAALYFAGVRP